MASVKFLLNRPKSEKPTSILVRFHARQTGSVTLSTGEMIPPVYWDGQRVKSKYKGYDRINKHLSTIEAELLDCWRDNKGETRLCLIQLVHKVVKGAPASEKKTVIEALRKFIAQYEKEKERGTVKRYRAVLSKIEKYNPDLTFEDLDQNFYDHFKNWLYDNPNPLYRGFHLDFDNRSGSYIVALGADVTRPVGLFDDVVFKYFINLKTLCAWAEKRGYTVNPSYKNWEIITRQYEPISLTQDELHKIEALHFTQKHLEVARDYLSLECRTGQRISDLRRFSQNDIHGNVWTFNQKKGARLNAKTVSLPLVGYCAPALVILEKYNFQLPKINEQRLNNYIKIVCRKAGITQPILITRWAGNKKITIPFEKCDYITTHTGRKTFITIALQFMSERMVMNITGIKSSKTLNHYSSESEIGLVESGLRRIEDNVAIMKKSG